jgi:hypothetical protein
VGLKESYHKMKAFAWKSESRADRRGVLLEKGACFSAFKHKWLINHLYVMPQFQHTQKTIFRRKYKDITQDPRLIMCEV